MWVGLHTASSCPEEKLCLYTVSFGSRVAKKSSPEVGSCLDMMGTMLSSKNVQHVKVAMNCPALDATSC